MARTVDENSVDLTLSVWVSSRKAEIWKISYEDIDYVFVWNKDWVLGDMLRHIKPWAV